MTISSFMRLIFRTCQLSQKLKNVAINSYYVMYGSKSDVIKTKEKSTKKDKWAFKSQLKQDLNTKSPTS